MRSFTTLSITLIGSVIAVATACSSDPAPDGTGGSGGASGGAASGGATSGGTSSGGTAAGGTNSGGSTSGGASSGGAGTGGSTFSCTPAMGIQDPAAVGVDLATEIYAYADELASCVDTLTVEAGQICISGNAGQVVNQMWDTIWGGGVGLKTTMSDLSGYEGYSFTLTATAMPSELRVGVLMSGDSNDYFTTDVVEGHNEIAFADLANGDWVDPAGTLDPTMIAEMKWQVPSNANENQVFSFCVSNITLETTVMGMGGATGTGGTGGGGTGGTGGTGGGAAELTFVDDVQPIFMNNCGGGNNTCHFDNDPSGGFDMSAGYTAFMERIVAGYSDQSLLYQKISGTTAGAQMPFMQDPLAQMDIDKIKDWIDGGALEEPEN